MSKLHSKTFSEPESSNSSSYFFRLLIIVICVCLALALFLFDQDDINYFAGGVTSGLYPHNPMGKWGAYTAWYMMLTFGLAAPVTVALVFFCALRRLLFNKFLYAAIIMWVFLLVRRIRFKFSRQAALTMVVTCSGYIGMSTTLYISFDYISEATGYRVRQHHPICSGSTIAHY